MIRLWNTVTGQTLGELEGGASWVERIAWSHSGTLLASSAGRCVRLWNTAGQMVRNWTDFPSTVADLRWKPECLELAVAAYGQLTFWNPDEANPLREFNWKGSMLTIAWSPDGKYLATGDQDSTVHFWIVADGEDLMMSGYETKVRELSWDHTSRYLATGGGAEPCVWDVSGDGPEGTRPTQLKAHSGRVTALSYQHAGMKLASAGADGLIAIWRPDIADRPIARAKTSLGWTQLAWSPDDRRLAAGGQSGLVAVYSL